MSCHTSEDDEDDDQSYFIFDFHKLISTSVAFSNDESP